ncbi:MAG: sulfatase-like hydrolase/transferase [Chloroflexi bacterium]|nr:sulfatase-like hydrolase/transferase [Chloroflexota bacterium]
MNSTQNPYNVLFIMTDNQPADLLGCYGNSEIYTPNLDRLAQQGMQFDNAYCPNGMCSPCRASVLTGLMPSQHGIHTWLDDRIMNQWPEQWNAIEEFITLPQILHARGYKTALIGKYHVGVPDQPQNGFEHWVTFPYGHTRSFWHNTIIDNGTQYEYPGHSVDCFTEKAVEYIQSHQPDSDPPFFMFLTYNAPYGHKPAIQGEAQNRFAQRYEDCPMTTIPREGLSRETIIRYDLKKHQTGGGIDYSDELTTPNDLVSMRNYYSQMSMVDDGVGQVLAALQKQGLDENTLVIFTSDHGFSLGHNGFWGHGQATWPANTHRAAFSIPLLVRHTNHIAPMQTSQLMVNSVDLFATILAYLGLQQAEINENTPSNSFAPLLHGHKLTWENATFMEQEETRAIRTDKWLYMKRFQGSVQFPFEDALYNLIDDPGEKQNMIADPDVAEIANELSSRIDIFFNQYTHATYDLWQGGSAKSNSDKPWLWQDAWGASWHPL